MRIPTLDRESVRFVICSTGSRGACVVDGDTIWYQGDRVRLADIKTPESSAPRCAEEAVLGQAYTVRLQELLNQGAFTLAPVERERDRYGRLLLTVTRAGESPGATLIREGLAEPWQGYRRDWC